ncbi:hypothetical protein P154DRAFT_618636 [Amniculicola lignicola CBS 123094]|uniref:LCCL domain-containing protein n=1 Tax=Amniculicola lignicola CBS 123094 TaxID=1392246 RepID=A0A6A5WN76_9PLEO|nr:hypothetical protein P154DRAFT_618636 [Amniculicola lignicola CBS 123094]
MPPAADHAGPYSNHDEPDTGHGAEEDEEAHLIPSERFEIEDDGDAGVRRGRGDYGDTDSSQGQRSFIQKWTRRPYPLRPHTIHPIWPGIQQVPARFLDRVATSKRRKIGLLVGATIVWALLFLLGLSSQFPLTDGTGQAVINLDCVDTLWGYKNSCGLGGIDCRPFTNDSFAFRCPANCRGVMVLNPRAVGPVEVNYRPLVIGEGPYRADSFICGSGIHAGVVSDEKGGCGRVTRAGEYTGFLDSEKNGISSIPFNSYFPFSFSVEKDGSFSCPSSPRQPLLLLSLLFTATISIFTPAPSLFFLLFTTLFLHVSFVSDPPSASYHTPTVLPDHLSTFSSRLLPALFCATVLYRTTIHRTLSGLTAPIEKTILWLGAWWFGALSNYTFDWIPIQRLTAHDLEQQPGAKLALVGILILLVFIIVQQIHAFWWEGRLARYLALYALFIGGILFCLLIPSVNFRIHHYILALLLLPGTGMQTRPSLVYQGVLLGLFVNGVARWGFDGVLQTSGELRGDAAVGGLVPNVSMMGFGAEMMGSRGVTFEWEMDGAMGVGMHGISALVNDVERFRGFWEEGEGEGEGVGEMGTGVKNGEDGQDGDAEQKGHFTWQRDVGLEVPEYFRFAYVRDGLTLDYTKAGVLWPNWTWTDIPDT